MAYGPRLTIDDYVLAVLRADFALLPPRKPGCYGVWHSDFHGSEPQVSDKDQIVLVGKIERTGAELLYRVTCLVLDAIGMTGAGNKPGTKYSFSIRVGATSSSTTETSMLGSCSSHGVTMSVLLAKNTESTPCSRAVGDS